MIEPRRRHSTTQSQETPSPSYPAAAAVPAERIRLRRRPVILLLNRRVHPHRPLPQLSSRRPPRPAAAPTAPSHATPAHPAAQDRSPASAFPAANSPPSPCPARCHRSHRRRCHASSQTAHAFSTASRCVPQKRNIPTAPHIVQHRRQKQRSRIRRRILIRQRLPVHIRSRLRILMHHLAVSPLAAQQKLQLLPRQLKVPIAIQRIDRIQRIPPEEPSKPRPSRITRREIPRHQRRLAARLRLRSQLPNRSLRPSKLLIQRVIWSLDRRQRSLLLAIHAQHAPHRSSGKCRSNACSFGLQRSARRRLLRPPHRHQQRIHPSPIRLRIDMQPKLQRMHLRPLLIRRHNPARRSRQRHRSGKLRKVRMQHDTDPLAPLRTHSGEGVPKPGSGHIGRISAVNRKSGPRAAPNPPGTAPPLPSPPAYSPGQTSSAAPSAQYAQYVIVVRSGRTSISRAIVVQIERHIGYPSTSASIVR